MAPSLRAGLASLKSLDPILDAVLVCTCDQPLVSAHDRRKLIDRHRTGALPISPAAYDGTTGVPALFSSEIFDDLRSLEGQQGARTLLRLRADRVQAVPLPPGGVGHRHSPRSATSSPPLTLVAGSLAHDSVHHP